MTAYKPWEDPISTCSFSFNGIDLLGNSATRQFDDAPWVLPTRSAKTTVVIARGKSDEVLLYSSGLAVASGKISGKGSGKSIPEQFAAG
jgi:hypothetical protein